MQALYIHRLKIKGICLEGTYTEILDGLQGIKQGITFCV